MLFLLAAMAAPRPTDSVGPAVVPPVRAEYRSLSRTSRFGFGFEVAGGGIIGPSIDVRLVGDLWIALAVKPRISIVGGSDGDTRVNLMGTLSLTYPLFTARRWSFRAKLAAGGTIPIVDHFESIGTLGPSVAFWTRRGAELSWTVAPGLYPYRNINGREADWQGFLYVDFALRFHFDAEKVRRHRPVYTPEPPSQAPATIEPDATEPAAPTEPAPANGADNGWGDVLEKSEVQSDGSEHPGSVPAR